MIGLLDFRHAPAPTVFMGHNPAALSEVVSGLVIDALRNCDCKILYRDETGGHAEQQLGRGLRRAPMQGTYCAMHLEREAHGLLSHIAPPGVDPAAIDRMNLYISPPRAGAPLHFDTRWAIIVQLSGCKLWQVSDGPAVARPLHNVVANQDAGTAIHDDDLLHLPDRMHFALLEPGDWLLVPWATWHGTHSRTGSVSATLAFGESVVPDISAFINNPGCAVPPGGRRLLC